MAWGGFTTKYLLRCQVVARQVALVYIWWRLFVRCAEPKRSREAVTSRRLLLCALGRVVETGRQLTLLLTSTHAEAARAHHLLTGLSLFLSGLQNAAEQLSPAACWERIWARILEPWRRPVAALPGPTGETGGGGVWRGPNECQPDRADRPVQRSVVSTAAFRLNGKLRSAKNRKAGLALDKIRPCPY